MSQVRTLTFPFPEPKPLPTRLIPCFLPFAGCVTRCIYCNQYLQTGSSSNDLENALQNLKTLLAHTQGNYSLAFFGGTFTGLPWSWQERFLQVAVKYREKGQIQHLRLSTRPDCLDHHLDQLLAHGVDMIELGIQSFDAQTLNQSKRGYSPQCALDACTLVKTKGLELGIQLLPGLPGHDQKKWRNDVRTTISLAPSIVRIYPCVVMANTGLEHMFNRQAYIPWTLEQCIPEMGWGLLHFWEAGIRVIRLGLAAEKNMLKHMVAGPWHPALGNMARSEAIKLLLKKYLQALGRPYRLLQAWMPQHLSGDLWGHKRANVSSLGHLGITPSQVKFWSSPNIVMEVEI